LSDYSVFSKLKSLPLRRNLSLRKKIIFAIILVFVLFGSVFARFLVSEMETKERHRLERKMVLIENLLSQTNAALLYEWDIRKIEKNIRPLSLDSEISSIHVEGGEGYIDLFVGERATAATNAALIIKNFEVYHSGQSVGTITATFSTAPINDQIQTDVLHFLTAFVALLAAVILTLFFLIKKITEPISELTAFAREIADGNLEKTITIKNGGEIGLLADSFTRMQTAIKGMLHRLEVESEKNRRTAHLSLKHQEAILEIATQASRAEDWRQWITRVTVTAAEALDVDRASFWLFNEEGDEISCVDLYQRSATLHSSGGSIHKVRCSAYFDAILTEKILRIDDAAKDPRMAGLVDWYCRPQNIFSLLDTTIYFQGKIFGILCLEYIGAPRTWSAEEVLCVERFSDQVTLLLAEIYERNIGRIDRILIEANDPEQLLKNVAAGSSAIFNCDRVGILYSDNERTTPFAAYGNFPVKASLPEAPAAEFFARLDAALGATCPAELAVTGGAAIPNDLKDYEISSFFVSNQRQGSERLALVLQLYQQERHWFRFDKILLKDIADRFRSRMVRLVLAQELRTAEQYISSIINSMPSTLISVDGAGRITHWNQTATDVTGFSEEVVCGEPLNKIMPDFASYMEGIDLSIKEQRVQRFSRSTNKNSTERIIEKITIFPLITESSEGAVIRIDDVTREHQLENQLNHKRKMEAIGTLAGGIAHDFNNMLGAIIGGVEMISKYAPDDPKIAKYAKVIKGSAINAADLTKQLLTFSRRSGQGSTIIDLHEVIHTAYTLLQRTIDPRISFSFDLTAGKSAIAGDSSNLENMFLNLGINAAHAMPEGGKISFSTKAVELDSHLCETSAFAIEPGPYISISVCDTGVGISPEHLDKVFEPFFTTKGVKGTGLGLASVYGAVQQHRGAIHIDSEVGKGTCFHILLPLAEGELTTKTQTATKGPGERKGAGCILVVDDEVSMRTMAQEILEYFGFEVLAASNGRQALQIYREQAQRIKLVLLDNTMPEMNGKDCLTALKKINPQVKIIMASGNTQEQEQLEMKVLGLNRFIHKPYFPDELGNAVFATLE
jgi:PAS domain S-box-containing protein